MKFLILSLFLTFSTITGANAQQASTELPDYTKWVMELDHRESYLYQEKDIQLRDQHYILEQATSKQLVLVYYRPEDPNKAWFAIHMILDSSDKLSGSLFEKNDTSWSFTQNLSGDDLNDMAKIFKSKYSLSKKRS